jgi:uncharacterized membrane-anchored protein
MALRVDPNPSLSPLAVAILIIGMVIGIVNQVGSFIQLTATEAGALGIIVVILTALATLLTTIEDEQPVVDY